MDPLELPCFVEEAAFERAREDGKSSAISVAAASPHHLGFHRGFEVGSELGRCYATVLHSATLPGSTTGPDKIQAHLEKVRTLCDTFPRTNDDVELDRLLTQLKSQHAKLCSLLRIRLQNPESSTF